MNALLVTLFLCAAPSSPEADAVVQQAFGAPEAAAASPAREAPEAPAGRFFGWALALAAVATVAAMALKRRGQKESGGYAEVAQNLSVGPKRSLLVVDFGGKRMLVGSTETGFSVLASEPLPQGHTEFDRSLEAQLESWAAQTTTVKPEGAA